jgi:nuclear GTP-binding protein
LIQIPNICPFKEEILKDVEADRVRREEEKKQNLDRMRLERLEAKKKQSLESIAASATERGENHVEKGENADDYQGQHKTKENSLKSYFKEFKKVVDAADVILEVCDARDPLGTRCAEVSTIIRESTGKKKHVLVLNKSDLIPRENLDKWLKYLRKFGPVIPFKASTQTQKKNIGRRKFNKKKTQNVQSSPCVGADLLMSLLGNYSRNKDMKTSIRVGIVGIPNVGKSSIINSLKRRRACQVGANPGITRTMQEVEIDSNIKIIDSPGIIFQRPKDESPDEFFALKNAQHINTVQDPFPLASDILKRATIMYFCKLYDITEYRSPEEFLAKKAIKMGKLIRGGVPDVRSAARSLIHDWNIGKIKYCTQPPLDNTLDIHLGASIVTNPSEQKELEIDNLEELEGNFMTQLNEHYSFGTEDFVMEVETKGPVLMKTEKKQREKESYGDGDIIEEDVEQVLQTEKKKKRKAEDDGYDTKKLKSDPVFQIAGNQSLNKQNKNSAKKLKKQKVKTDKKISNVADVLDNFSLGGGDYDFDEDYVVESD